MTRPMPPRERRTLVEQYRGRRRVLAEAAHAWLRHHEDPEKYSIDWSRWKEADAARQARSPYYGTLTTEPQCLCEEDFLRDVLWAFVSNAPLPPSEKI